MIANIVATVWAEGKCNWGDLADRLNLPEFDQFPIPMPDGEVDFRVSYDSDFRTGSGTTGIHLRLRIEADAVLDRDIRLGGLELERSLHLIFTASFADVDELGNAFNNWNSDDPNAAKLEGELSADLRFKLPDLPNTEFLQVRTGDANGWLTLRLSANATAMGGTEGSKLELNASILDALEISACLPGLGSDPVVEVQVSELLGQLSLEPGNTQATLELGAAASFNMIVPTNLPDLPITPYLRPLLDQFNRSGSADIRLKLDTRNGKKEIALDCQFVGLDFPVDLYSLLRQALGQVSIASGPISGEFSLSSISVVLSEEPAFSMEIKTPLQSVSACLALAMGRTSGLELRLGIEGGVSLPEGAQAKTGYAIIKSADEKKVLGFRNDAGKAFMPKGTNLEIPADAKVEDTVRQVILDTDDKLWGYVDAGGILKNAKGILKGADDRSKSGVRMPIILPPVSRDMFGFLKGESIKTSRGDPGVHIDSFIYKRLSDDGQDRYNSMLDMYFDMVEKLTGAAEDLHTLLAYQDGRAWRVQPPKGKEIENDRPITIAAGFYAERAKNRRLKKTSEIAIGFRLSGETEWRLLLARPALIFDKFSLVLPFQNPRNIRIEGQVRVGVEGPMEAIKQYALALGVSADMLYFYLESKGNEAIRLPLPGYDDISVRIGQLRIGFGFAKRSFVCAFVGDLAFPEALVDDLDTSANLGTGVRVPVQSKLDFQFEIIPITVKEHIIPIPMFKFNLDLRRDISPGLLNARTCEPYWDGLQLVVPGVVRWSLKHISYNPILALLACSNSDFDGDVMFGDDKNGLTVIADDIFWAYGLDGPYAVLLSPFLQIPFCNNFCIGVRIAGFRVNFNLQRPIPSFSPLAVFEVLALVADPANYPVDPHGELANTIQASIKDVTFIFPEEVRRMLPSLELVHNRPLNRTINMADYIRLVQFILKLLEPWATGLVDLGKRLTEKTRRKADKRTRNAIEESLESARSLQATPPELAELLRLLPPELRGLRVSADLGGFSGSAALLLANDKQTRDLFHQRDAKGEKKPPDPRKEFTHDSEETILPSLNWDVLLSDLDGLDGSKGSFQPQFKGISRLPYWSGSLDPANNPLGVDEFISFSEKDLDLIPPKWYAPETVTNYVPLLIRAESVTSTPFTTQKKLHALVTELAATARWYNDLKLPHGDRERVKFPLKINPGIAGLYSHLPALLQRRLRARSAEKPTVKLCEAVLTEIAAQLCVAHRQWAQATAPTDTNTAMPGKLPSETLHLFTLLSPDTQHKLSKQKKGGSLTGMLREVLLAELKDILSGGGSKAFSRTGTNKRTNKSSSLTIPSVTGTSRKRQPSKVAADAQRTYETELEKLADAMPQAGRWWNAKDDSVQYPWDKTSSKARADSWWLQLFLQLSKDLQNLFEEHKPGNALSALLRTTLIEELYRLFLAPPIPAGTTTGSAGTGTEQPPASGPAEECILAAATVQILGDVNARFLGHIYADGNFRFVSTASLKNLTLHTVGIEMPIPLSMSGRATLSGIANREYFSGTLQLNGFADWRVLPGILEIRLGSQKAPLGLLASSSGQFSLKGNGDLNLFNQLQSGWTFDISNSHALLSGSLSQDFYGLLQVNGDVSGSVGPGARFELGGKLEGSLLGISFAGGRFKLTEHSASIACELSLENDTWALPGRNRFSLPNCTLYAALQGEIGAGQHSPVMDLRGSGHIDLNDFEIACDGDFRITAQGPDFTASLNGSLEWEGLSWAGGRLTVRPEKLVVGGRIALDMRASDILPDILSEQVTDCFLGLGLDVELTFDRSGVLLSWRIHGMTTLGLALAGSSQMLPIYSKAIDANGEGILDLELIPALDTRLLPKDVMSLDLPMPGLGSGGMISMRRETYHYDWRRENPTKPSEHSATIIVDYPGGSWTSPPFNIESGDNDNFHFTVPADFTLNIEPVTITIPTLASIPAISLKWLDEDKKLALHAGTRVFSLSGRPL